jgi:hypothetical protein
MKRAFCILLLICGTALMTTAQSAKYNSERCSSETIQRINVRGFYLGMSMSQAISKFNYSPKDVKFFSKQARVPNRFGVYKLSAPSDRLKDKTKAENVNSVSFTFLNMRLAHFSINYNAPEWENVNQFVNKLSDFFKLPQSQFWEKTNLDSRSILCGNYLVGVSINPKINGGQFWFGKIGIDTIPDALKKQIKERQRQAFKP